MSSVSPRSREAQTRTSSKAFQAALRATKGPQGLHCLRQAHRAPPKAHRLQPQRLHGHGLHCLRQPTGSGPRLQQEPISMHCITTVYICMTTIRHLANKMSKSADAKVLLALPLPMELKAKIASYRDSWCGATEKDCQGVLRIWDNYKPRNLNKTS